MFGNSRFLSKITLLTKCFRPKNPLFCLFIVIIVEGSSLSTLPNSKMEIYLVRTFAEVEKTINQLGNVYLAENVQFKESLKAHWE